MSRPFGVKRSLETLTEGTCIQALHVGGYDDEGELIARMHDEFMPEHGLRPTGHHHEIYLPRGAAAHHPSATGRAARLTRDADECAGC